MFYLQAKNLQHCSILYTNGWIWLWWWCALQCRWVHVKRVSLDTRTVHNTPALLRPVSRPLIVVHPGPSHRSKYGNRSIEFNLLNLNPYLLKLLDSYQPNLEICWSDLELSWWQNDENTSHVWVCDPFIITVFSDSILLWPSAWLSSW